MKRSLLWRLLRAQLLHRFAMHLRRIGLVSKAGTAAATGILDAVEAVEVGAGAVAASIAVAGAVAAATVLEADATCRSPSMHRRGATKISRWTRRRPKGMYPSFYPENRSRSTERNRRNRPRLPAQPSIRLLKRRVRP